MASDETKSGKRVGLIILGLLLLGLCALWFLTPLQDVVREAMSPDLEPSSRGAPGEFAARRGQRHLQTSTWDKLRVVFDGLNALFGALGVFFAVKGWRGWGGRAKAQ